MKELPNDGFETSRGALRLGIGTFFLSNLRIIGLLVQYRNQVFEFFSSRLRCFPFIARTIFRSMKPSKTALRSVGPLLSFCFPGPAECAERLNLTILKIRQALCPGRVKSRLVRCPGAVLDCMFTIIFDNACPTSLGPRKCATRSLFAGYLPDSRCGSRPKKPIARR